MTSALCSGPTARRPPAAGSRCHRTWKYSGSSATIADMNAITVPPQSGRAVSVSRGTAIAVVDVDGHQVGDMWAIDAQDHGRWLSASHTRDRCERLFPAIGEQFRDQHGEPILQLAADTSPGLHDMLFPPCDPPLYQSADCPPTPTAATTS